MSRFGATCLVLVALGSGAAHAGQSTPGNPQPPAQPASTTRWIVRNLTRVEVWRFFDPAPGSGNPDYTFVANRLFAGVDVRRPRVDVSAGLQYVQFGGLPTRATGPGPLGTGALYFDQGGRSTSRHVYLRTLNLRLKDVGTRGVTLQLGRFGYTSGAESASGDAKIESVKRQRLDSRLIGEFEWSIYQRTFDGARLDVDRPDWHATASWLEPTQGGFEDAAGTPMTHVGAAAVTFTLKPGAALRHTDWQGFLYRYDDTRPVRGRPDNTFTPAPSVDVHITSVGTSLVGAYAAPDGQVDVFLWLVGQRGDWFGQQHRAGAIAAEAGYQRTSAAWRPWVRGGWFRSTGDENAADSKHGTFFQMLPTVRRYALSTAYNLMNLNEVFGQVLLRPRADLSLRADLHGLHLTQATDLWYGGSGATQRTGGTFGYAGRRSNGATALGTIVEAAADWTVSPHLSINGYLGRMHGGRVVTGTFEGDWLGFGYFETNISF